MFSGFSKLISDELTQFDINNLTSFDDLQNTLDPALVVENNKEADQKEGKLDVIEEDPATASAGPPSEKISSVFPEVSAGSAHAESGQSQPEVKTSRPTKSDTVGASSGNSGVDFFRSFEVPSGLSGTPAAADSNGDDVGDTALVQSLRLELNEAKELARTESEQRRIFQNMVRDAAQNQVWLEDLFVNFKNFVFSQSNLPEFYRP